MLYAAPLLFLRFSLPLTSKEKPFISYVTLMLLWAIEIKQQKKQVIKRGGWNIYFGKRKKNSDWRKVKEEGRAKTLAGVKVSSMLGWELTVSARKTFRSGPIQGGMLRVIKAGEMDI